MSFDLEFYVIDFREVVSFFFRNDWVIVCVVFKFKLRFLLYMEVEGD